MIIRWTENGQVEEKKRRDLEVSALIFNQKRWSPSAQTKAKLLSLSSACPSVTSINVLTFLLLLPSLSSWFFWKNPGPNCFFSGQFNAQHRSTTVDLCSPRLSIAFRWRMTTASPPIVSWTISSIGSNNSNSIQLNSLVWKRSFSSVSVGSTLACRRRRWFRRITVLFFCCRYASTERIQDRGKLTRSSTNHLGSIHTNS